ncbi:tyrosine-type recombinase/integrase [Gemmata sp.]|uniref:tyrosine-type recombinase/integrase n=1 Tax=Gemmata sp. TaxID=1914242 RepID=UPI003F6F82EB
MPRPKSLTPQYIRHSASGRGRFVWTDPAGTRHDKLLPGEFNGQESRTAFTKMMLEWQASPSGAAPAAGGRPALSVAEVLVRYLAHATMYYKPRDGKPASALVEVKLVVRAIRALYGTLPVTEFGPLKLRAVQQGWVSSGLSRAECNKRLGVAKRLFKWAVAEELVPPSVFQALATVGGLQKGHTPAHEPDPVGPVDDAVVDATLPHLVRHVQGLIQVQRLTGMRPGEVTRLRMSEIDTTGDVWVFRPKKHKNEHRGHTRAVAIGKRAQEVIAQFRTADDADYLFSPHRAMQEMQAERTAKRRTKKYPSEVKKAAKQKKGHRYNDHYTTVRYGIAIARACDRAFPAPVPLGQRAGETQKAWRERLTPNQRDALKEWQDAHRWAPNRLRHAFATKVRKAHGLEAAQVTLGHARADVTQVYAEKNEALAVAIAEKLG